jgi:hypothetical protein
MFNVIKNKLMQNVISQLDHNERYIESGVSHLTSRDLIITEDYVIFTCPGGYTKEFMDSWKNDLAGLEGNVNDFHVDQALDTNIEQTGKRIDYGIAHGLFQKSIIACEEIFKLIKKYNDLDDSDIFTIYFSIDSYDPEIDHDRGEIIEWSSSLRFTKKREGSSWFGQDLEDFNQPVMTIDFDKKAIQNIPPNWWATGLDHLVQQVNI